MAVQAYVQGNGAGQRPLIYLVSTDGSPTIRIDSAVDPSWSPDGRFLVATEAVDAGNSWVSGSLAAMNADGSGRHDLGTAGVGGPLVWVGR